MKLWQLIKSHLGPYRDVLLVVVVLQAIATFASLTLPTDQCPTDRQRRVEG